MRLLIEQWVGKPVDRFYQRVSLPLQQKIFHPQANPCYQKVAETLHYFYPLRFAHHRRIETTTDSDLSRHQAQAHGQHYQPNHAALTQTPAMAHQTLARSQSTLPYSPALTEVIGVQHPVTQTLEMVRQTRAHRQSAPPASPDFTQVVRAQHPVTPVLEMVRQTPGHRQNIPPASPDFIDAIGHQGASATMIEMTNINKPVRTHSQENSTGLAINEHQSPAIQAELHQGTTADRVMSLVSTFNEKRIYPRLLQALVAEESFDLKKIDSDYINGCLRKMMSYLYAPDHANDVAYQDVLRLFQRIVEKSSPAQLNAQAPDGQTLLHQALRLTKKNNLPRSVPLIAKLIQHGAHVHRPDQQGITAFDLALDTRCMELIAEMLKASDLNLTTPGKNRFTEYPFTPLEYAAYLVYRVGYHQRHAHHRQDVKQMVDIFDLILAQSSAAVINQTDINGKTLLDTLREFSSGEPSDLCKPLIDKLLQAGAEHQAKPATQTTATPMATSPDDSHAEYFDASSEYREDFQGEDIFWDAREN